MSAQETLITETIGEKLKRHRIARSLSVNDVCEELNIQPAFVTAIEELNQDALPPIGYVLGYVRAYAELMGLNGQDSVNQYKVDSAIPENLGMRDRPHFVSRRNFKLPRGFFAATTVMSCAAVLAFWYGSNTEVQSATFTPSGQVPISVETVQANETAQDQLLTLKAVAPSWVEIKNADGEVLISRIFVPGDSWQTDRSELILLSARDAGALEVLIGTQSQGKIGDKGSPIYDYILSAGQTGAISSQ